MSGILAAASAAGGTSFTVSCSPTAVTGIWDSELGVGFTDYVSALPTGGVAPYTFSWIKVSGTDFGVAPSTTTETVQFTFSGPTYRAAVYRGTATDALGRTASADVSVTAN